MERDIRLIFANKTKRYYLLVGLLSILLCFVLLDRYYKPFAIVRYYIAYVTYPIAWVPLLLRDFSVSVKGYWSDKQDLIEDRTRLRSELLRQQQQLLTLESIKAENARLHALLSSKVFSSVQQAGKQNDEHVILSKFMRYDINPLKKIVVIDKGSRDGVEVGAAVLNTQGVFGQILSTKSYSSRVLLLTDIEHVVSVENTRTGEYLLAAGDGDDKLKLLYVPNGGDVMVGDVLVTSGLGNRYPAGYYIGEVLTTLNAKKQKFMEIIASSASKYEYNQLLMVLPVNEEEITAVDRVLENK